MNAAAARRAERGGTVSKKIDLLIKDVQIVDPQKGGTEKGCIAVCGGKFTAYDPHETYDAADEIHAEGFYASPGWIDAHTHIFKDGTEPGFAADLSLIPMGVTATIDGGSCGVGTWPIFKKTVVDAGYLKVFYSVNVSPSGQITERYPENVDPAHYDAAGIAAVFAADPLHARGLKLRYGAEVVEGIEGNVLDAVIALAEELDCAVTVHITNPAEPIEQIVARLRPGDVVCHTYQGKGNSTVVDSAGNVKPEVLAARERGVYFDSADARINHCYRVIRPALAQGFRPDIISTDLTKNGLFNNMCWGLPVVLSKWLNLGLSLEEVVAACTWNPASIHRLPGGIGTLAVGAPADLTIFRVAERPFRLRNRMGETFDGTKLILPEVTVIDGTVRYKNLDFPF